jgi:hypothetical protein
MLMSADDAIAKRGAMHAALDIDELHTSVAERLALRDPPGEWLVMKCSSAVRLFLTADTKPVSRYVWCWQETDAVIDLLAARSVARANGS